MTAAAVALGVGLLLVTLASINAVHAQDARTAWLITSQHNLRPSVNEATSDPLWGLANLDEYRNVVIERVDVAATGPHSPVPPGIPQPPRARRVLRLAGSRSSPCVDSARRAWRSVTRAGK